MEELELQLDSETAQRPQAPGLNRRDFLFGLAVLTATGLIEGCKTKESGKKVGEIEIKGHKVEVHETTLPGMETEMIP